MIKANNKFKNKVSYNDMIQNKTLDEFRGKESEIKEGEKK